MKILYSNYAKNFDNSALAKHGINNCCLKEIIQKNDYKKATLKPHRHIEYELHIVFSGKQNYEICNEIYQISENEFIIIPPNIQHRILFSSKNLVKYSVTFNSAKQLTNSLHKGEITKNIEESIRFISEEYRKKLLLSNTLVENRVLEIMITILRICGSNEDCENNGSPACDILVEIAKKFINENITRNLTASDVATYSHISTRQLSRRFANAEGISPSKYINDKKMEEIGNYVKESTLSLREISELFSYSSDSYFNSSFKKHFGMSPLTYRNMFR